MIFAGSIDRLAVESPVIHLARRSDEHFELTRFFVSAVGGELAHSASTIESDLERDRDSLARRWVIGEDLARCRASDGWGQIRSKSDYRIGRRQIGMSSSCAETHIHIPTSRSRARADPQTPRDRMRRIEA